MPSFIKKETVVKAIQWTGENLEELMKWGSSEGDEKIQRVATGNDPTQLAIFTWAG